MHLITWLGYRALFNSASPTRRARRPQMGTESRSRCRSRSTNRPYGGRTLPFFVAKKLFEQWFDYWLICGSWHVSLSKFFRRSWSLTDEGLAPVSSRSRTAAIAIGHNRKPPSPIKYDGAHCFGKRYLDQSIYNTDENADRSYLSGNLAGENVVLSMTKLSFCYTGLTIVSP